MRRVLIAATAALVGMASAVVATAAPEGGSITVTPDTGLVDGQTITVQGSGFSAADVLRVFQCEVPAEVGNCRSVTAAADATPVGGGGTFTASGRVRTVFTGFAGPVDCRTDACAIAVDHAFRIDSGAGPAEGGDFPLAAVPVAFDPLGPLLPPPTLVATPDVGLVDGQTVAVSGTGYRPDVLVGIGLCPTAHSSLGDCDYSGPFPASVRADGIGAISTTVEMAARIAPFGPPVDCRVDACSLVAFERAFPDDELVATPLGLDPGAPLRPPAEAGVSPVTGLVDRQVVQVDGSGFRAHGGYVIEQCLDDGTGDFFDCAYDYRGGQATEDGGVSTTFRVRARFDSFTNVDCFTDSCVLVLQYDAGSDPIVLPLAFDPSTAPGPPPLEQSCDIVTFDDAEIGLFGGVTPGPDGNVWFDAIDVGDRARIGFVTPAGRITTFDLGPHVTQVAAITAGPDGNLWFTTDDRIGRSTPSGVIAWFSDPRIDEGGDIVAGPDGNLWFTRRQSSGLGRITPAGAFSFFDDPAIGEPRDLGIGPDGEIWYADGPSGSIRRITSTGSVSTVASGPLPTTSGLVTGPDGNLWTSLPYERQVARISPSGAISRFGAPDELREPNDMVAGPEGALWFVLAQNDRIGRVETDGTVTTFIDAEDDLDEPRAITLGPDGRLWLSAQGTGLGRVDRCGVAAPPVAALPGFTG